MSFGLKDPITGDEALKQAYTDIHEQIKKASKTAFFATAANYGIHKSRTFPALCNKVFYIHASDGKGMDGGINPKPEGNDNFMTLGMAIPFINTKDLKNFKYRLETSYAVPIAAAMAAHILYITECLIDLDGTCRKKLRSRKGI